MNIQIFENSNNQKQHSIIQGYQLLNENNLKTTELITIISENAKEQQTGIEQINDAVNALDHATQENAAAATVTNYISQKKNNKISNTNRYINF